MERKDPFSNFRFYIELDNMMSAGFSEVSGIESKIEIQTYKEGGVNDRVYSYPTGTTHSEIVLKRGLTYSMDFWYWYDKATRGKIERKSGAIVLVDENLEEQVRWSFYNAYPVYWKGPQLNANMSDIAVEEVHLVHEGIKMSKKKRS